MSWKSVELQVALPRVQDAGKQQDLMSKQGQRLQETLSQEQLQEEIKKRRQVQEFEEIDKTKVDDEENPSKEKAETPPTKQPPKKQEQSIKVRHPYLGSRFDFNG